MKITSKESQFTYLYNKIIQTILVSMDNITNEKLRSLFKPITITQSHQKACGKDGDHMQGAFIKLGGYAFSTFSIEGYGNSHCGLGTSLCCIDISR